MIYKVVKPKEIANPIYDTIYYIMIDDPILEQTVTDKLEYTINSLKDRPSGTLSLLFYYNKPSTGWFSKDEKIEIERWNIPFQWYALYDKSYTHSIKENRIRFVYHSLLDKLSTVPTFVYQVINDYLPFDIIDSNKTNSLKDILQFIVNGPPKLQLF
jgi:hypothetical protein